MMLDKKNINNMCCILYMNDKSNKTFEKEVDYLNLT